MANLTSRLRKALKKVSQPQTGWLDVFPAVIGKEDGTVNTGIAGEIYVRNVLNGQTLTVHNSVAPAIATLQVEVGRRVEQPGLWQIKGIRESFSTPAGRNNVPYHANQHTFPAADTLWVDRKQILALTVLVSDAANTLVKVFGATVRTATGVALIESQEIDLSSYIPATGAIYVSIESDNDGVLTVHAGTGFDAPELASAADVPVPVAGKYMLAYVLLTEGMEELSNDNIRVPIALETDYTGINTGAQIHAASASAVTDDDEFGFWEDVSGLLKKITWANIKATLKTYFDTLYASFSFKTISVSGQSDVVADAKDDTLTLVAGTNITITTDAGADSVTIAASGGSYTDEQAQDAVGGILDNASVGDVAFTYDDTTPKISGVVKKSSQSFALTGIISPAALGSNQNNWNPTGLSNANVIYVTLSASINLTGLAGGADGRVIVIIRENDGFDLTLPYEDSNSTAANRFQYMDAGTAVVLGGHSICLLQYSSTLARWIVMQPGKTTEQIEDIVGAMVSSNTETGISVTYNDTDGKLNFDAQTAGDARYAPIAKGVTNGDSHDHSGGDGGTISYASLSGTPTIPTDITPIDGWVSISASATSGTLDAPSFEISFNADMTALISLGDRIKLTQSTTKYFIVTKVGAFSAGATIITCYGGTDYTLVASGTTAITNVYYSHSKSPLGFPPSPDKWTVSASNTANANKTPPAANTWYGGAGLTNTGISIDVPIGVWKGFYKGVLEVTDTTVTDYNIYSTLAVTNSSETDTNSTFFVALTVPSGTYKVWNVISPPVTISCTSKTTHYMNIKTSTSTADSIHIRGDVVPTIIKLVCAYL